MFSSKPKQFVAEPYLDEPRQQFFEREPYEYSNNPFGYLATASWSKNARTEASKPLQIVMVRTLEPDRQGKSKKQIAREFLSESSCNQMYHGSHHDQAALQQMLKQQQQKKKKKEKKLAYQKRRKMAAKVSSRPCEFDINLLALLCQSFDEEYCSNESGTGTLGKRQQSVMAAQDDAYKDDFSSDSEEKDQTKEVIDEAGKQSKSM